MGGAPKAWLTTVALYMVEMVGALSNLDLLQTRSSAWASRLRRSGKYREAQQNPDR